MFSVRPQDKVVRLGEAAVLVTDGQRCLPRAAEARGYAWEHPAIDASLAARIP